MDDDFYGILFVLVILSTIITTIISGVIAAGKNRSGGLWAVLGFVFGWLAVLIIACLPKERHEYIQAKAYVDGRTQPIEHNPQWVERAIQEKIEREKAEGDEPYVDRTARSNEHGIRWVQAIQGKLDEEEADDDEQYIPLK